MEICSLHINNLLLFLFACYKVNVGLFTLTPNGQINIYLVWREGNEFLTILLYGVL